MTDSKESFPRLIGPTYFQRLHSIIAELDTPLPSVSEDVSQHDKDLADILCETLNWMGDNEERKFTGDPIQPIPNHPIVPLILEKLGMVDPLPDQQV